MSEKYENPSATYNIPLNISENAIFRIGRAHLQHFINVNVKMDDCKPIMLKMHLELNDSSPSSIGEAAGRNIEENSSINGLRQTVQQLEEEMKALKDALLQAKEDDVINRIDHAPKDDNNATQESITNKQANNENNLSDEQHNDIDRVAKASGGHHTATIPKEKPEVIDLRDNCVYIQNFKCSDKSLEKAFCNVRKLANGMNAKIPENSIIHIDVRWKRENYLDYYVHFRNADFKEKFLKNRHFYVYHPETNRLRIFDHNEWSIVDIKNVRSSDMSLEAAYVNVIEIAEKMGIPDDGNLRDSIDHIDVFSLKPNFLNYSVRFKFEFMINIFLQPKDILKQFPETKSLEILNAGGHRLGFRNLYNVSMTLASANVIGMAELMGLPSLTSDDFKRIYVLNYAPPYIYDTSGLSFVVEFSSKQLKDEFLKRKHKLHEMEYFYDDIEILDIKKNIALIKYTTGHLVTAFSFIGLAKQLGASLTPDQIKISLICLNSVMKKIDNFCTERKRKKWSIEE